MQQALAEPVPPCELVRVVRDDHGDDALQRRLLGWRDTQRSSQPRAGEGGLELRVLPGSSTRTLIPRSRAALVSLLRKSATLPAAGLIIRWAEETLASATGGVFLVRRLGLRRRAPIHPAL